MLHVLRHRKALIGVCISIVLTVIVAGLVWAFDRDSPDSAAIGSDASHAHSHPNGDSDVDDVAERVVTLMFSWEPAVDASTADALARAVPWLAEPMLSSARTPNPNLREDPGWASWRRAADIVTASVHVDGGATTSEAAHRYLTVTQQVQHLNSATTPLSTVSVRADLIHTSGGWRVSRITPIDTPKRVSTPQEGNPS